MKSIQRRTILAFLITAVLLIPVCILLGRSEIDSVTKKLARKGRAELYDIADLITVTSKEQSASVDRIQNNYSSYLQFMTKALGELVSEDGEYTGPRKPFEDGMVVSFQDQEPVLPEELPKGYPEDAPPLTEQLLRRWSLTGSADVFESGHRKQLPLQVGEIIPGTYYVDVIEDGDFTDFTGEEDFQKLIQRTEKVYQAAILALKTTKSEGGETKVSLEYESGYFPEEKNADRIGISAAMLKDRTSVVRLGDNWFVCSYWIKGNRAIVYAQPLAGHEKRIIAVLVITAVLIFFAATLMIAFCQYASQYVRSFVMTPIQAERYSPRRLLRSAIARCIIYSLAVFAASMLIRSVWQLHTVVLSSKSDLEIAASSYRDNIEEKQVEDLKDREEWYVYYGDHMARLFSEYPDLATDERLKEYADILELDYIMLFDEKGKQTTSSTGYTNMVLGRGQGENSGDFRRLLLGVPEIVHDISEDSVTGLKEKYIGVSIPVRKSSQKSSRGHKAMILAVAPEKVQPAQGLAFEDQLTRYEEYGEDMLVADADTGKILYSGPAYDAKDAVIGDFGIGKNSLKDNYMDFLRVNGNLSFVLTNEAEPGIYYKISDVFEIYNGVLQHGLIAMIYTLVLLSILILFLTWDYTDNVYQSRRKEAGQQREEHIPREELSISLHWKHRLPEEKTQTLFRIILSILVGIVFLIAFRDQMRGSSLASYIMYGDWARGFNLFALCRIGMVAGLVFIGVTLLRLVLRMIGSYSGSKGKTVCKLALSFVQYIMVFVVMYYTFEYLGFPTGSVISVLTLSTLAVSLGSKDLVTDILAGIAIIFEDEFRVGDIVEVKGFRGTVQEIGLRSTILRGLSDNLKIIKNGDIHEAVNMGRHNSSYYLPLKVPATVSLETCERILKRELPRIGEKNEKVLGGPDYLGVEEVSVYFLKLTIRTECAEEDYYDIRRYINREVWLALRKEGISLPPLRFETRNAEPGQSGKRRIAKEDEEC